MKNQNILNNLCAANIFIPLLVTFLQRFENKRYLPVGSSRRWTIHEIFLGLDSFSYITRLHHFPKYIILNNILKVDNILNRGSNNTSCAPSVPLFRIHWQLERLNTGKQSITWWRRSRWSKTKLCFTHAWIRRICILYFLYSTCNMLVYRRTRDQVWLRDRSGSHAVYIDISFEFVQAPCPALQGQLFRS